jgi:hypothetical protein
MVTVIFLDKAITSEVDDANITINPGQSELDGVASVQAVRDHMHVICCSAPSR